MTILSKYTTEVRWFCESKYRGDDTENIENVIQATYPYILKADLITEMFDPDYYPIIAKKIIRHYYFREIGAETVALWIFWMNTRFRELLPYYNALWKSALLEFDPFKDVDYTREGNKAGQNQESSTGKNTEVSNGSANESNNFSNSEQVNSESTETGNANKNRSETGRETSDRVTNNVGGGDSTTTDSGEENTSNLNSTTKVTDNDSSTHIDETTDGNVNHSSTDNKWDLYSDTPQGSIVNVNLTGEAYLTNARNNTDTFSEQTITKETHKGDTTGKIDETITENGAVTGKTAFGKIVDNVENSHNEETENTSLNKNNIESENSSNNRTLKDSDNKLSTGASKKVYSNTGNKEIENTGLRTGNEQEKWLEHITGKMNTISYSELLEKYRKTFLNIDLMFIKEFDDLFMRLW